MMVPIRNMWVKVRTGLVDVRLLTLQRSQRTPTPKRHVMVIVKNPWGADDRLYKMPRVQVIWHPLSGDG